MRSATVIRKSGAYALLIALFSSLGISAASAADIPSLLWERGRQQTVTFGGVDSQNKWSIKMVGPGQTQNFKRSSGNSEGFYVYSANIPRDQKLGEYRVIVSGKDRDDEVVAYVKISKAISYNLLSDPETLGVLAVVLSVIGSTFSGNRSNLGGSAGYEEGNPDDPDRDQENTGSVENVGSEALVTSDDAKGTFDRLGLGRNTFVASMDAHRHSWIQGLAPRSRAWMRVVADASWLQALAGPAALVTPVVGFVLGMTIFFNQDFSASVIPSATPAFIALIALGVFDALAGAIGGAALFATIIISGNIKTTADIRGMMGLTVLFFLPILIAGALRPLRRSRQSFSWWERATDYLLAPIFTFWAIKSLVNAIDGFVQQQTALSQSAEKIALTSSALIVVRLLCEDLAQKLAPARIEFLSAPKVRSMDGYYQFTSLAVKTCIYLFFMYGFLQYSWQGFIAIAFLVLPQIIKIFADKLPNFPRLFQIIPGGVPGIVFTAVLGLLVSNWVNSLPLVAEDKSRTIFILVGIPGFILSLLKIIGRSPAEGDVRWYRRKKFNALYRIGGIAMYVLALSIVSGVLL